MSTVVEKKLLDRLERAALGHFMEEISPANGLLADTSRQGSPASIARKNFKSGCDRRSSASAMTAAGPCARISRASSPGRLVRALPGRALKSAVAAIAIL
jgi:hypothetical protein